MKPRKRQTYTVTADPDILRRSGEILALLAVTRSAFLESQLIALIRWAEPLAPLLQAIQDGTADPGEVKAQLRRQLPEVQDLMAAAHSDVADLMRWSVNTQNE